MVAARTGLTALAAPKAKASPAKVTRSADDQVSLNPAATALSSLIDLAKKVPAVKRTSDEAKYARDNLVRNAFVHVIDLLEKNPSYTMECWSWLDTRIHGAAERPDDRWDESYVNWVKVVELVRPRPWKMCWWCLVGSSPPYPLRNSGRPIRFMSRFPVVFLSSACVPGWSVALKLSSGHASTLFIRSGPGP